ncbi:MAG: Hpt domain-containing protein [Planctomycetota bacterium]|nr:Hpt domain-containing protein [Planctomycetota bacterium]
MNQGPLLSTRPLHNARLRAAVLSFVQKLDEQLDNMLHAYESQDFVQLGELAHRLKGSSANCGFQPLADLAGQVEQLAKQDDNEQIPSRLHELRDLKSRISVPEQDVGDTVQTVSPDVAAIPSGD